MDERMIQARLERLPLMADMPLARYGITTAIALAATFVRLLADPVLPPGYPFLTFFPAVILSAFLFGRGLGVYAALVCGLLSWYLFIPPYGAFRLDRGVVLSLVFYAAVVTVDVALVHWMQVANARMVRERERNRLLAETRETLFRELQHRISNNIQMVAALLTLQKREVADPGAIAALDEAARRLGTIGRLHRQLHDPRGEPIGLGRYLDQICRDVIDGAGMRGVTLLVDVDEAMILQADAAIPVALIVAEAVANAIEHGFAGRERGTIRVTLAYGSAGADFSDTMPALVISDDGHGLPEGFSLAATQSLGLTIAATLARQIGVTFRLAPAPGGGTEAWLGLPAAAATGA
jgi:two-component sensor histidine kinase